MDLGYYFVNEIIGEITGQSQDEYIEQIYDQMIEKHRIFTKK